jgi:hypothetical protein
LPLPDAWVPGYSGYVRAIEAFEGAMLGVLKVRVAMVLMLRPGEGGGGLGLC